MTGKEKLYFLLDAIDDVRAIAPSGQPLIIDPMNDLKDNIREVELSQLFTKLEKDEHVLKILKIPSRIKDLPNELDPDPYDYSDDGCWHIKFLPGFDKYYLKIQLGREYQKFTGKILNRQQKTKILDLSLLHPEILKKCQSLFKKEEYPEAVEKGFKVVRDRLRKLTSYETGSEAFGKGKLHIKGAAAPHVDNDFNEGVKFLTMAIDKFRNEKSHTSDAKIDNHQRTYEYLALSSLAMNLLDQAEVITI